MRLDNCAGLQEAMEIGLSEGKCDECRYYVGKITGDLVSDFVPAVVGGAGAALAEDGPAEPAMPTGPTCDEGLMPWQANPECCVPNSAFIGDGACDPDAPYNTAACGYDGGDCCMETCNQNSAFGCKTKWDDDLGSYGPFGFFCIDPYQSSAVDPVLCDVDEKSRIGDGQCNPMYNTPECGYDGGDCCEETCNVEFSFFPCGSGILSYDCVDPRFNAVTNAPTKKSPSKLPTKFPTKLPTRAPSDHPTSGPTPHPTRHPTRHPRTKTPTPVPTLGPTLSPIQKPTTKVPTRQPTNHPTRTPTKRPVQKGPTCPTDMKECENGTYVFRIPDNNCAFAACPVTTTVKYQCGSTRKECPDGTFVKADPENDCTFPPCPTVIPQEEGEVVIPQEEGEVVIPQEEGEPSEQLSLADSIASQMAERPKASPQPTRMPTSKPSLGLIAEKKIACAKDLRECPKTGHYVGRNPHNHCQFLQCPAPEPVQNMAASVSSSYEQNIPPMSAPTPNALPVSAQTSPDTHAEFYSSKYEQDALLWVNDDHIAECAKDLRECPGTEIYVGRNPHDSCRFLECPDLEPMEPMATSVHGKYNSQITTPTKRPTQRPTTRISCPDDRYPCSNDTSVGRNPENGCRFFECTKTNENDMNPMSDRIDARYAGAGSYHKKKKKRSWHTR